MPEENSGLTVIRFLQDYMESVFRLLMRFPIMSEPKSEEMVKLISRNTPGGYLRLMLRKLGLLIKNCLLKLNMFGMLKPELKPVSWLMRRFFQQLNLNLIRSEGN